MSEFLLNASMAGLANAGVDIWAGMAVLGALGFVVDKLNVGALGNLTPQLHVHVIGRRVGDPAWPGPVWGHSPAESYGQDDLARVATAAKAALGLA